MEWHGENCRFTPRRPLPLPRLHIKVEIVAEAHDAFQRPITKQKWANVHHHDGIQAYADSGAQTCACGLDALHSLGLHETDLIPTSHRILGVTSTAMDIVGVFLAKLSVDSACTRQVVYVSRNTTGFFPFPWCSSSVRMSAINVPFTTE